MRQNMPRQHSRLLAEMQGKCQNHSEGEKRVRRLDAKRRFCTEAHAYQEKRTLQEPQVTHQPPDEWPGVDQGLR